MEKSKLLYLFPLEEIPIPDEMLKVQVDENEILAMLQLLRNDHAVILPVQSSIIQNDFVRLEGPSQMINTTKNKDCLLARECIGHVVGDRLSSGQQIVSVKRKIAPEIGDAFAPALALQGVDDLEGLRNYCRTEILKKKYKRQEESVIDFLENEWLQRSKFDLDNQELQNAADGLRSALDKMIQDAGSATLELLDRFLRMMGVDASCDDLDVSKALRICAEKHLQTALLGNYCLTKYGARIDRVAYQKEVTKYAQQDHVSVEKVDREYPYSLFLNHKCGLQIRTEIRRYLKSHNLIVSR